MKARTIRTTISLPIDLHKQLRWQAIQQGMTVGELIASKLEKNEDLVAERKIHLKQLAKTVVGSIDSSESGWNKDKV